jgi:hypothetical protein
MASLWLMKTGTRTQVADMAMLSACIIFWSLRPSSTLPWYSRIQKYIDLGNRVKAIW